jgi:cytochrome c peroxidase
LAGLGVQCSQRAAVGGGMYMKLGLVQPYETADVGRFEVTKVESDKGGFKVPSRRNIAKTGPYFHDGSIVTLEDAVAKMGKHQLGKTLDEAQVKSVVAFLGALTGDLPGPDVISKPTLPESGPTTPKPDPS